MFDITWISKISLVYLVIQNARMKTISINCTFNLNYSEFVTSGN